METAQIIQIPNHHSRYPLPDIKTDESRYVSVFENRHGEQLLLSVDRSTKIGQFAGGDLEWRVEEVSEDRLMPKYRFDQAEMAWYAACWMAILGKPMEEVIARCQ